MAAFDEGAFGKDTAFDSGAFDFGAAAAGLSTANKYRGFIKNVGRMMVLFVLVA